MQKEKKDKDFVKSAYYEGGKSALEAFVKSELRYPKEALQKKVEGTVSIRYTVDYKGNVVDASVISGLGHGCDEEALRIVRILKFKVPEDGKIKSRYTRKLHIHFRLPGSGSKMSSTKKVTPSPITIQYQYEVTTKKPQPAPVAKPLSYEIMITLPKKEEKA